MPRDRLRVDALVVVEVGVFDGEHRDRDLGRDVLERHRQAVDGALQALGQRHEHAVERAEERAEHQEAAETGTDRIELYTEGYARGFAAGEAKEAVAAYTIAAVRAKELGLGLNAGHDLDRFNLQFFKKHIPGLDEVSIGHALICDALYLGLENTIQIYKRQLA